MRAGNLQTGALHALQPFPSRDEGREHEVAERPSSKQERRSASRSTAM